MNYVVPKLKTKELKYHLGTGHFKKHEEGKLEKDISSWVDFSLLGICSLHIYVVKHWIESTISISLFVFLFKNPEKRRKGKTAASQRCRDQNYSSLKQLRKKLTRQFQVTVSRETKLQPEVGIWLKTKETKDKGQSLIWRLSLGKKEMEELHWTNRLGLYNIYKYKTRKTKTWKGGNEINNPERKIC